ncbi:MULTISPECIES: hypothetical protein [Nocardia]|uniref:hypothetical protein n=1 Tax=Nocardia TaxID=1817 RepID=UPI000D690916|nr:MULTISPECIES: hypothetical protein [Nocardia]
MAEKPMQALIDNARSGQLSMSFNDNIYVNAEEFVYIDRDCEAMKTKIQQLQAVAEGISGRETWGLGESAEWIRSAKILVGTFRTKAKGADNGNDVFAILEQHYAIIDSIQQLHKEIAQRYLQADTDFAARYNELMATLPQGFQGKK